MVSTGLAIRDTMQLERENIRDGWLRIERQKTGKPVFQQFDEGLYRELLKADGDRDTSSGMARALRDFASDRRGRMTYAS